MVNSGLIQQSRVVARRPGLSCTDAAAAWESITAITAVWSSGSCRPCGHGATAAVAGAAPASQWGVVGALAMPRPKNLCSSYGGLLGWSKLPTSAAPAVAGLLSPCSSVLPRAATRRPCDSKYYSQPPSVTPPASLRPPAAMVGLKAGRWLLAAAGSSQPGPPGGFHSCDMRRHAHCNVPLSREQQDNTGRCLDLQS